MNQKPKCPTCNRTIPKKMERYSITEFHRKVKEITNISSLIAKKDYILRVIKYYFSQDAFNNFVHELDVAISNVTNSVIERQGSVIERQDSHNVIERQDSFTEEKQYEQELKSTHDIKKWILSYFMNTPSLELRGLTYQRNTSLIKQLQEYIISEYISNDKDLNVPFSQFYEDFCMTILPLNYADNSQSKHSKHSISRALKVLGIKTMVKKIENKTQTCLFNSKEELQTLFSIYDL